MAFYQVFNDEELIEAPNFVNGPGYDLYAEDHETYTYPIHGWLWFDLREDAEAYYGMPVSNAR